MRGWCVVLAVCALLFDVTAAANRRSLRDVSRRGQDKANKAVREATHERLNARQTNSSTTATSQFLTSATAKYKVDSLPDVNFDIGEMYSGLIPIDEKNASRALFFMFNPTIGKPVDEITIWLNGGPGCSSLEGFFQENGRFLWQPGTFAPVENPYSWVNLTNMLWVEQPVGTGFSIGEVTATTEEEIAQDFIKFFKNWETTFGIKNYKIYVTGESYAGRYVPYISAAMLDEKDKEYYDLSGALVYDPCIGQFDYTQEEVPAVPFVLENQALLQFNDSFLAQLESLDQSCGYAEYREKYLTFPPPGNQPAVFFNYTSEANCDVFDMIDNAALENNPCFDIYEVNQQCPLLWDVLSFPTQLVYTPEGAMTYFNRSDVKAAIHAPSYVDWAECAVNPVIVGGVEVDGYYNGGPEGEGDLSADPIQHVLPQVIEATSRVLVSNGDFDMIIITNGTLMAIQNMTWNGKLGFQREPDTPIVINEIDLEYQSVFDANGYNGADGPQGTMGVQHYERGLMWAETYLSGHMQPEFQPRVTYRHLEWVLGRIDVL
ncbi:hypothetical protein IMSHALPRED_002558 [Imshaugia aleurites]|uniref:Carboxypeptidase n=1 Tax=Imshaugia aleurites TaxID=172621 RepID=A0A8H3PIZ6_9LECA|nr:hypothetical protein IMSHALPRED_002558 [Imshaugia aleurites]